MNFRATIFLIPFAAGACASGSGSPSTSQSRVSDDVTVCAEPAAMDTAGWNTVITPMYAARAPQKFQRGPRDVALEVWGLGGREIGYSWGEEPEFTHAGAQTTLMSSCHTTVAGHPVEISLLKWKVDDSGDASQAAGSSILVETARWHGPGRDALIWVLSASRRDIERYRQVFWTVQFQPGALQ